MNKYNEIEIQTAKNLLEQGYKWIVRNKYGRLYALSEKPIKSNNNLWVTTGNAMYVCRFVPIFQSIRYDDKELVSLERIVHPQILDDVEREYLSAVVRPFRNDVQYIVKCDGGHFGENFGNFEEIIVSYKYKPCGDAIAFDLLDLPPFEKGTMYKGMKANRKYTLEELGL